MGFSPRVNRHHHSLGSSDARSTPPDRFGVLHLQHLAVAAHEGSARAHEAAWRNLAVPPLEESVKEAKPREASQDVLFEGMAVWGLNLRQSGTTVQAAEPLLL